MARRRQEIEAFVRHVVVEVEAAEAAGMIAPQAIAGHFNATGVTTHKGPAPDRRDCDQIPRQAARQVLPFGWESGVHGEAEGQS
jgi:hypothetical protein